MSAPRARPKLDNDNRPFWTGGAEGKLNIFKCRDCGEYTHPPRQVCRHCRSEAVFPDAVAGTGSIESYTINYQKWQPALETPYVVARVRLDGVPGVYLITNIVGCAVDQVDFDDKVRVVFDEQDGIWYPLFERIEKAAETTLEKVN